MKLLTVVGARPQFVKAAAVDWAIRRANAAGASIRSVIVHTGQHTSPDMSRVFFDDLELTTPDYQLDGAPGPGRARTLHMREAVEGVLAIESPDVVLVYGDTNSTLAGALAAVRCRVPLAHVEAGIRSFNRRMREEFNRVITDQLSATLFCPTDTALANLASEGITNGAVLVGDVMFEVVNRYADRVAPPAAWNDWSIPPGGYVLATIHRAENTDDRSRLRAIVGALADLATTLPVIFPIHPRTRALLPMLDLALPDALRVMPPLRYGEMLAAQQSAAVVVTDSGGLQKEAYWLGVPCVTARDETEWPETLVDRRNVLAGAERAHLVSEALRQAARGRLTKPHVAHTRASHEIVERLMTSARD